MRQLLWIAFGMLLFSSSILSAGSTQFFFTNLRQMSMGGVGVTISDGDLALLNNPAGLADVQDVQIKLPRFLLGAGTEFSDRSSDINEFINSTDEDEQLDSLQTLVPFKSGIEANVSPIASIAAPQVGFGVFSGSLIFPKLYRKTSPRFNIDGFTDIAPAFGYGRYFDMFGSEVALGISAKYVFRNRILVSMSSAELIDAVNKGEKFVNLSQFEQSSASFDIGMLTKWTLDGVDGRLGFSLRNIGAKLVGDRTFENNAGLTVKESVEEEVPLLGTIGVGMKAKLPYVYEVLIAADYDLISEGSFYRRVHLGIEKKLYVFNLRAGINQGNLVGGFGVDLWVFHLDYAYNVREFGNEIGKDRVEYHVIEIGLI